MIAEVNATGPPPMIAEFKATGPRAARWCGIDIEQGGDGEVYTRWGGEWWVLTGPDPRCNVWSADKHHWRQRESSPDVGAALAAANSEAA